MKKKKKMKNKMSMEYKAYHEAGHTLLTLRYGFPFDGVEINHKSGLTRSVPSYNPIVEINPGEYMTRENALKSKKYSHKVKEQDEKDMKMYVRIILAGQVVTDIKYGKTHGRAMDDEMALILLNKLNINVKGPVMPFPLLKFFLETSTLCTRYWYKIEAIKDALLEKNKLTEKEIKAVYRKTIRSNKDASKYFTAILDTDMARILKKKGEWVPHMERA